MKNAFTILFVFFGYFSYSQAQSTLNQPESKIGIGVGPSFLYGDNTGVMREFKFKIQPTVSVDFTRNLDTHIDLRATLGWQMINSGDFYTDAIIQRIANAGFPHAFQGNLFFADAMPSYIINPDRAGFVPSLIKVFGGAGVGVFHSARTDERRIYEGDSFETEVYRDSNTSVYFPVRIGAFMDMPSSNGELGLEGTLMISPFANMEGNSRQQKVVGSDIAVQLQVYYRIYLK